MKIADSGNNEAKIQWSQFVLQGLLDELTKAEKLTDVDYVKDSILKPVLQDALRKGVISKDESAALHIALQTPVFQASDFSSIWADPFVRSRNVRKLLSAGLIAPIKEGARKYYLKFTNGPLMVSLMHVMNNQGFLPESMLKNQ